MNVFKLIGGLCLAVPAVLLLAVGPRKTVTVPDGFTVVEYWEKWTGHEGEGIAATVKAFNETRGREKKIYVNLLSTSGIVQKTGIATAGGVPPDLAGLWEPGIPQMAALGALTPLDELVKQYNAASPPVTVEAKRYKKVFWDMCNYDGKLYALVSTPYCYALHYNTDIFAKDADKLKAAGLDPTRPPRTIKELDAYAKALDIVENGQVKRTGYLPLEPGWDLAWMPYNFGGSWWDEKAKKFTFTSPPVEECFTWVQGYSERLGKDAVANFRSAVGNYDSPTNAFLSGTTAIVSQGTFFANVIHTQKSGQMDGKWAAAPLPTNVPGLENVTSATADVLCIPKGAKHPKEAFEFVAWLQEQKNMEALCRAHTKISPLAEVSEDFLENHSNPYVAVFDKLAASPNAHPTPQIEIMTQVTAEMTIFIQDLANQRVTPDAGLAKMQTVLQKKYDDFIAKQALWEHK